MNRNNLQPVISVDRLLNLGPLVEQTYKKTSLVTKAADMLLSTENANFSYNIANISY